MSFILEALRKSENKRRKKTAQMPRSIHEPVAYKITKPRSWPLWALFFLVVNAAVLVWLFGPWKDTPSLPVAELSQVSIARVEPPPPKISATVTPQDISPLLQKNQDSPAVVVRTPAQESTLKPETNALPVLRNEKQVYSFQQLPATIRSQIPDLQMSLHAYNRADTRASMVQLNNQIYREGEQINGKLLLEQITAEGAVIRFDGYCFLLPRRGN